MAKKGERPNGTTRFGEGFVWEKKETREDDWWQVRRTQDEGSEYNWLCMANKLMYDVNRCYMVEVEEPVYVQVLHK